MSIELHVVVDPKTQHCPCKFFKTSLVYVMWTKENLNIASGVIWLHSNDPDGTRRIVRGFWRRCLMYKNASLKLQMNRNDLLERQIRYQKDDRMPHEIQLQQIRCTVSQSLVSIHRSCFVKLWPPSEKELYVRWPAEVYLAWKELTTRLELFQTCT